MQSKICLKFLGIKYIFPEVFAHIFNFSLLSAYFHIIMYDKIQYDGVQMSSQNFSSIYHMAWYKNWEISYYYGVVKEWKLYTELEVIKGVVLEI